MNKVLNDELLDADELLVSLSNHFGITFKKHTITKLRKEEKIPFVDARSFGSKTPRWKFDLKKVIVAIEKM